MVLSAAQHFYKALKVYPNKAELLEIYKKTVPEVPCRLKPPADERSHIILSWVSRMLRKQKSPSHKRLRWIDEMRPIVRIH